LPPLINLEEKKHYFIVIMIDPGHDHSTSDMWLIIDSQPAPEFYFWFATKKLLIAWGLELIIII